ncbi:MAG: hypothetical protein IKU07_07385 [Oscillospiraceae bacterium]|nr:hypothetical protein [Oscillospiraceae bacterium]
MKRTLAVVLCIVLLALMVPSQVFGQGLSSHEAVKQEVSRIYAKCLESAGKESFAGFCGLMTSLQLWHLGVNRELTATHNGNEQFDAYKDVAVTSGGYHVTAYPAEMFTLEQALAAITQNGTRDADNILVGFESTNTEAGSVYGHALVIHTIMDGTVYYVENYYTSLAGPEGSVIACSIDQFVRFYQDWTVLEGVIHFGDRRYSDSCQAFGTDLYVRTRFGSTLRSQPSLIGENDCRRIRTLAAGELLHATAVYMNKDGEMFYYIDEGHYSGYVAAKAVSISRMNLEALSARDISIPETMKPGEDPKLGGIATAYDCSISTMSAIVTDDMDNTVLEAELDTTGSTCNFSSLNEQLDLSQLAEGSYTVSLYATAACVTARGNGLVTMYSRQLMGSGALQVGEAVTARRSAPQEAEETFPNGWSVKSGVWYYYKNGKPCTGWFTYLGVEYYLNSDGSVSTGWAEIDGFRRYFSPTGAVCTGWVTAPDGIHHWLPDGTEAMGKQVIEGKLYFFDQEGILITNSTVEDEGVTYKIGQDGIAVEK